MYKVLFEKLRPRLSVDVNNNYSSKRVNMSQKEKANVVSAVWTFSWVVRCTVQYSIFKFTWPRTFDQNLFTYLQKCTVFGERIAGPTI